jgi:hypothetical protein
MLYYLRTTRGRGAVPFVPTFLETFSQPSATRGRAGDLDPTIWGVGRLTANGISTDRVNKTRPATIPAACRATFAGGTSVYPPDDSLICDGTSTNPGTLMSGIVIQNYGNHSYMIRQPFDIAGRAGSIRFDVDAVCGNALWTYIQMDFTDEPVPCPSFHIVDNDETGPLPKNGLALSWSDTATGYTTIGTAHVYTTFAKTVLSPTVTVTGTSRPTVLQDKLNRIEVRLSTTLVEVRMSDYSPDGFTFSNFRLIYSAPMTLPFTRGYVHLGARNHASVKYAAASASHVYHWDNVSFDGPLLSAPRAYEIPDNTTSGTSTDTTENDYPYTYRNLGYEVSDGTNRAVGVWSPTALISPLTFTGTVNLSGMSSALLTLNLFVQTVATTPDTTWGLKYKFNGGTFRTRLLTSDEVSILINDAGCGGYLCLAIPITFADLTSGTNTVDFSGVNLPMGYPPLVQNIDLLLSP